MKVRSAVCYTLSIWACAGIVLSACSIEASETSEVAVPEIRVLSARERSEEAWELAREWRDDVELKEIQAGIFGPDRPGATPLVDFVFESPSEQERRFIVGCSAAGCGGRAIRVPYLLGFGSVDLDDGMIDSMEAATIGVENGGSELVYSGSATTMWVRLGRDKPRDTGPVVWLAYFAGPGEQVNVVIDPYTAEVIRLE